MRALDPNVLDQAIRNELCGSSNVLSAGLCDIVVVSSTLYRTGNVNILSSYSGSFAEQQQMQTLCEEASTDCFCEEQSPCVGASKCCIYLDSDTSQRRRLDEQRSSTLPIVCEASNATHCQTYLPDAFLDRGIIVRFFSGPLHEFYAADDAATYNASLVILRQFLTGINLVPRQDGTLRASPVVASSGVASESCLVSTFLNDVNNEDNEEDVFALQVLENDEAVLSVPPFGTA